MATVQMIRYDERSYQVGDVIAPDPNAEGSDILTGYPTDGSGQPAGPIVGMYRMSDLLNCYLVEGEAADGRFPNRVYMRRPRVLCVLSKKRG